MACKILTNKTAGKSPLRSPRRRWEDNIRIYLKEIGINTRNWVDSAQDKDYCRDLMNSELSFLVLNIMELVSL